MREQYCCESPVAAAIMDSDALQSGQDLGPKDRLVCLDGPIFGFPGRLLCHPLLELGPPSRAETRYLLG